MDELRSRRRRARLVDALSTPPLPPRDPSLRVELEEAVATLTPTLRETLLLVELFGFTYRETAEALGIPEGTAKRRVFDARKQLARKLTEKGEADAL
jgi:RNA polymerase sigma-70 factor (ECF subfamily)